MGKIYKQEWKQNKKCTIKDSDDPALTYWKARKNQALARKKIDRLQMIKQSVEGRLL